MIDVILGASHIAETFGHVQALKDIILSLRKGQVHTLLGENGAGKSTLMKIPAGAYPSVQETMILHGETITINNPQHSRQLRIAIILQELSPSNSMTMAEDIYVDNEPRRFGIINDKEMLINYQNLLAELDIPLDPLEMVDNMSVAHRQLVGTAKVLSYTTDAVIMDEPTSSLGDNEAEILFNIVEKLKQRGRTVIYTSHHMNGIVRTSDDISVIRNDEYIVTHEKKNGDVQHSIVQMAGQEVKNIQSVRLGEKPNEGVPAKPEVKNLSHPLSFREVSFTIRPGEILGSFDLMGARRSDVMKMLFGLVSYHGTVLVDGKGVRITDPKRAIDYDIVFVTENRREGGLALIHGINMNTHHVAFQYDTLRMGLIDHQQEETRTPQPIVRMNIKMSSVCQIVGALSGGNQQKIVLSRWPEKTSRTLLLDKPTRGADVDAKFEIHNVTRQLAAAETVTILVFSELPGVMALNDRLAVMRNKAIASIYSCEDLTQTQVMTAATGVR